MDNTPRSPGTLPSVASLDEAAAYFRDHVRPESDYLAADGKPVVVGDRFHLPGQDQQRYEVNAIDKLHVYMKPVGWATPPKVTKKWKMARKGWIRCT